MPLNPTPVGIRCAWCDTYFEWTQPNRGATRPLYCDPSCRKASADRAAEKREGAPPGVCPFPWKARFRNADAATAVIAANPVTRTGNRPYLCPGGEHHHLGRLTKPDVKPLVTIPPPPAPRLPPGARPGPPPRRVTAAPPVPA
jgi:hypothetical protein